MTLDTRRHTRLYTPERYREAQAAWRGFGPEWTYWRKLAASEAGILEPPEGSEWDSWEVHDPSERAIIIRAIRETPSLLERAIRAEGAPTWSRVVALLVRSRDAMRDRLDERLKAEADERRSEPSPRDATRSLKDILTVLADS